jgi:hypothetical protein
LDFSAVAGLVTECHLLFVPCYAPPEAMKRLGDVARVVSLAMKGTVILVNRFLAEEESEWLPSDAFCLGKRLKPQEAASTDATYRVRLYDLNTADIKAMKVSEYPLQGEARQYQWLFDPRLRKID